MSKFSGIFNVPGCDSRICILTVDGTKLTPKEKQQLQKVFGEMFKDHYYQATMAAVLAHIRANGGKDCVDLCGKITGIEYID